MTSTTSQPAHPFLHIAAIAAMAIAPGVVSAETLLIERVQEETMALPARGMDMAAVQARFGAPADKLDARGGQKRQWPTINRWTYPNFIVYFERDKVIDAVAIQADPTETGPAPPIR